MSNPEPSIEVSTHILVVAQAGHFRDSLGALLRTIPGAAVAALDVGEYRLDGGSAAPDIVLLDLGSCMKAFGETLIALKGAYAGARCVALVDNVLQTGAAYALGADCALIRSAPASELLLAVRRIDGVRALGSGRGSSLVDPSIDTGIKEFTARDAISAVTHTPVKGYERVL